jgi:hypothetical protein
MKLFQHYAALIIQARDVFQLQIVVRDACRSAGQLPLGLNKSADPAEYAAEVRRNLGYLEQILELADEKLKEFEEKLGNEGA